MALSQPRAATHKKLYTRINIIRMPIYVIADKGLIALNSLKLRLPPHLKGCKLADKANLCYVKLVGIEGFMRQYCTTCGYLVFFS